MLNFNEFLLENRGYSYDAEKISKYVIDCLENKDDWDDIEIINLRELKTGISEIILEIRKNFKIDKNRIASFNQHKSKYKKDNSTIYIIIDYDNITYGLLNHEIFHAYEWVKNKGNELTSEKEISIISLYDYFIAAQLKIGRFR